ncbi:NHL repeat-containing protein [Tistlia consotensis]|uniref:NHL repeat-containing protein n=1 Tax=Tistlia consotensis USBA 355 TaxID=560819 RepID=A0A1Y6BW94_9PROT|nr:NHL repeat-containing protein [Tistlia consotensis]SMF30643.1 NHL repeat-containing protein [Tistlia consotensis USBA 355]SNS19858.1 NHL repeat-containing protein [Tistlia consotensis]
MRVALAPSFQPLKAPGTATGGAPLADPAGPRVVLGWSEDALAAPLAPSRRSLFGPRGLCLHPEGSLWVADSGHHRLLGWRRLPMKDDAPADLLVGQPDFGREGRNAKGPVGLATLNVPTGVCAWGQGLAVADAWNHRVLLWHRTPAEPNRPADLVLGQDDAGAMLANRGADRPTAASLHWPYGVAEIDGKLVVADSGNRRVLVWDRPARNGQPADLVLGQTGFETRDENAGGPVGPVGMRWPHGLAWWRGRLAVSDAGNNRIMLWDGLPTRDGAPCDLVLGQADATGCDHNRGAYYPCAAALNMPYAVAVSEGRLIVADTANSRLLGWSEAAPDAPDAPADRLSGQVDFASKGDNAWRPAGRDTLCWPYGLSARDGLLAVADSGNNRVLLWDLAP